MHVALTSASSLSREVINKINILRIACKVERAIPSHLHDRNTVIKLLPELERDGCDVDVADDAPCGEHIV